MELKGKRNVETDPVTLWNMLMDVEILSGEFTGDMQMEDIRHQKTFTLKAQQHNKIGTVNSVMKIELMPISGKETEVAFSGEVTIGGLMKMMGEKVLGGVTDMLTKQFFANLDHEIAKQQAGK